MAVQDYVMVMPKHENDVFLFVKTSQGCTAALQQGQHHRLETDQKRNPRHGCPGFKKWL